MSMRERAYTLTIKLVSEEADRIQNTTGNLGNLAFSNKLTKAQIRGLENIANSTNKVSDIKDFIKRQTGRHEEWRKGNFGTRLLNEINNLENTAIWIETDVREHFHDEVPSKREIHILLIREFVKQVSSQYQYELVKPELMKQEDKNAQLVK